MTTLLQSNFLKKIKNLNGEEIDRLSDNICQSLSDIHIEKDSDINWMDEYIIDKNYSLYRHGLIKKQGLKDYILIDYINENIHLLKDRIVSRSIKDSSIIASDFDDNFNISFEKSDKFSDKIVDYLDLNIIAYVNKDLAKVLVNKINDNKFNIKFYKLFTYYTAKFTIDLIDGMSELNNKEDKEKYEAIIEFIFDSYDDFTLIKPKWLE
ncbi:hypothetical protein [uncultured Helcococcus sp.]|uniref:hypothetical protein n=1 Tax=uncultured Helcococcus sp. TaxID=1072508 RepID=UPI0026156B46|nr:hypothetical protein [uncultured Helcococcus sp.]